MLRIEVPNILRVEIPDVPRETVGRKEFDRAWDKVLSGADSGFSQVTQRDELWRTSEVRAQQIRRDFDQLAVVGMGGSSLGARAVYDFFQYEQFEPGEKILFFDNLDPLGVKRNLKRIKDPKRIHVALISKSGNTLETIALASVIEHYLSSHQIDLASRITIISEARENPLTKWAKQKSSIRGIHLGDADSLHLVLPNDIGGRFSVLTPVGLFPAAFLGIPLDELREGAAVALKQKELIFNLVNFMLHEWRQDKWLTLFWFYSDFFEAFGQWAIQLWSESLGKKHDRKGDRAPRVSTPLMAVGPRDQHSILQQVMEGFPDKSLFFFQVRRHESEKLSRVEFDQFEKLNDLSLGQILSAQLSGTRSALKSDGRDSVLLEIETLDARSLGNLFMSFELLVSLLGEVLDINAFDQPGVEAGKSLTKGILGL